MIARRRLLIGLGAGALAAPLAAFAQQPNRIARIGVLDPASPSSYAYAASAEAFRRGLRELGYVEGKNVVLEYRWAEGRAERLPGLAAESVGLKPDVIFASSPQGAIAAKKATAAIPVVFAGVGDPVGLGVVASLARPGGNVTGLTNFVVASSGKRLELLKESVPRVSSVAVLWNPMNPGNPMALKETEAAAKLLEIRLVALEVRNAGELDRAFKVATGGSVQALVLIPDPLINDHLRRIADFAAKNRLPAIHSRSEFADAGGLMAYALDAPAMYRRAALYVDRILKGAKPADLPVEEPTKMVLVVNLKTAKALGISVPRSVLARADRVIE